MFKYILVFSLFQICAFSQSSWNLLKIDNDKFTVLLPGMPIKSQQEINTDLGKLVMDIYMYQSATIDADNLSYNIIYTEYPKNVVNSSNTDKVPEFFRNAIKGAISNSAISKAKPEFFVAILQHHP